MQQALRDEVDHPDCGSGWDTIPGARIGASADVRVDLLLAHPDHGLALIDLQPGPLNNPLTALRDRLRAAGLETRFPEPAPAIYRHVPALDAALIGRLLEAGFADRPRPVAGNGWSAAVRAAVAPSADAVGPVGTPSDTVVPAPPAARALAAPPGASGAIPARGNPATAGADVAPPRGRRWAASAMGLAGAGLLAGVVLLISDTLRPSWFARLGPERVVTAPSRATPSLIDPSRSATLPTAEVAGSAVVIAPTGASPSSASGFAATNPAPPVRIPAATLPRSSSRPLDPPPPAPTASAAGAATAVWPVPAMAVHEPSRLTVPRISAGPDGPEHERRPESAMAGPDLAPLVVAEPIAVLPPLLDNGANPFPFATIEAPGARTVDAARSSASAPAPTLIAPAASSVGEVPASAVVAAPLSGPAAPNAALAPPALSGIAAPASTIIAAPPFAFMAAAPAIEDPGLAATFALPAPIAVPRSSIIAGPAASIIALPAPSVIAAPASSRIAGPPAAAASPAPSGLAPPAIVATAAALAGAASPEIAAPSSAVAPPASSEVDAAVSSTPAPPSAASPAPYRIAALAPGMIPVPALPELPPELPPQLPPKPLAAAAGQVAPSPVIMLPALPQRPSTKLAMALPPARRAAASMSPNGARPPWRKLAGVAAPSAAAATGAALLRKPVTRPADAPAPTKGPADRCFTVLNRAQLGEQLADADRTTLHNACPVRR